MLDNDHEDADNDQHSQILMADVPTSDTLPTPAHDPIAAMTPDQRATWKLTGKLPTDPAETPEGDELDPAEPVEIAETVEPEPVKADDPKAKKPRFNPQERINAITKEKADAIARAEAAERKAAELEAKFKPAEPTEPAVTSKEAVNAQAKIYTTPQGHAIDFSSGDPDVILKQFVDAGYADPYAAMNYFTPKAMLQFDRAERELVEARAEVQAIVESIQEAGMAKYPDWVESMNNPELNGITMPPHVRQLVHESEFSEDVLYHLSKNPSEIRVLAAMEPLAAAKTLGILESRLSGAISPPAAKPASADAPAPPTTLGTKPSVPNDDAESAIKAGDFRRYREVQNRRELAATR